MEHALEMKGNIQFQDSFFRRLFKEPKYRKALYTVLHPEDMDAADSEFENIELDNVLNVDIYNDICFTVRNRLVMLIEHQSTLNYNMPVRVFLYLAEEYKRLLLRSEFSSALYAAPLVKIPRPEFYIVYTGADACSPVMRLSDAFLECSPVRKTPDSMIELSIPVLTASESEGVLAEYFDIIGFIKDERSRCGSLETAVKHAIQKYQSGYEISDFIQNQRGVYETLFEQITREELLKRQLEANAKVITQQVTEQVTEQVTRQVTRQVKKDDINISYRMLIEAGVRPEKAVQSIVRNYGVDEKEMQGILTAG